jgi:hypothetical protein
LTADLQICARLLKDWDSEARARGEERKGASIGVAGGSMRLGL